MNDMNATKAINPNNPTNIAVSIMRFIFVSMKKPGVQWDANACCSMPLPARSLLMRGFVQLQAAFTQFRFPLCFVGGPDLGHRA